MRTSARSVQERLQDILTAIDHARHAVGSMPLEEFATDSIVRAATERWIEIISEASRHIPAKLKDTEPSIPWRDIADIGNILRHVYEKADPEIVWRVVQFDVGPLESAVRRMLKNLNSPS